MAQRSRTTDLSGVTHLEWTSEYQPGPATLRVLCPLRDPDKPRRVLLMLPVEPGPGQQWGDPIELACEHELARSLDVLIASPSYPDMPWYVDHPLDPGRRQESFLVQDVLGVLREEFAVQAGSGGVLLLGFSKSGWGAFHLLLRHPDVFAAAAAWDAPLVLDPQQNDRQGLLPAGLGTLDSVAALLEERAVLLQNPSEPRLILLGYDLFGPHMQRAHDLLRAMDIPHVFRDDLCIAHRWDAGWVLPAAELLACRQRD